ncbi:MAG: tail fiber domain-containing protein, partial [Candidatus Pacebacteria bacterium]|nr:tail fiber domain-containing protein [Candidatus Paceibacterota bacterium]
QNTGIRFSDGTYQTTAASAGGGADNIFDVTSNVVSNTGSDATVGTDDFVFGSTGLDDTGDTSHDSRFFFDKSKGAFRAGVTLTDEWDDANVGACSVAFGKQTCASGDYSAAFGLSTVASGARSTAFGSGSDATGGESVAFGVDTLASGNFAASFGCKSCATATAAASFGLCTDATGNYSFTTGRNTTASGTYSVALGGFSSAQGNSAFAAGGSNHACADNSVALGKKVTVTGACSTGIGLDNTARTISQTSTFAVLGGVAGFGTTTPQSELSVEGSILSSDLYGGATTLSVDANGNIIRTPSDERLKTNITPITNALEKVLSLNGVYYNWKDTNRFGSEREIGFIAQEVEDVVPEVVKSGGEYKSLNYQVLTALLAGAVQELSGYFDILGFKIVDGAAWFTQIYTERLVVGTPENPTGIILYDEDTGKPYCLTIVSGQVRTRSGNCDEGEEVEHTTTYHNGDYSQETIYEEEVVDEQATSTQETVNEEEPLLEEVNEEEVIEEPEEKEEVIIDEAEQEVEEVNEEEVIEEEEATPEEEVIGTEESESSEETPTE